MKTEGGVTAYPEEWLPVRGLIKLPEKGWKSKTGLARPRCNVNDLSHATLALIDLNHGKTRRLDRALHRHPNVASVQIPKRVRGSIGCRSTGEAKTHTPIPFSPSAITSTHFSL